MIRAFAIQFKDLLTQLSTDEKWHNNKSIQKAIVIGHTVLNDEIIPEKLIKLAIISVESENVDKDDELLILLLAILHSELEGSVHESLKCFERLAQLSHDPVQTQIVCFLALVRVTELHDYSNLLEDGLTILEYYKEDPVSILWELANQVSVKEHTATFLIFIEEVKEIAGPRLNLFVAWFYSEIGSYKKSLTAYLQAKEQLESGMEADALADLWHSIAICYINLSTPDPKNAMMAINKALQYDFLLGEFQNEIAYLATRAQIYLLLDGESIENKEKALADLKRVIEYNPDYEVALDLIRKIEAAD